MPIRTCVACRKTGEPDELIRLVRHPVDGRIVPDSKGNLPGRGAWVHAQRTCLEPLQSQPNRLQKALRDSIDASALVTDVCSMLDRNIQSGLSIAAAAGRLVGGADQIVDALSNNQIIALAFANDAAERTRRRLLSNADQRIETFDLIISSVKLGHLVGKGSRAAVGISAGGHSVWLMKQLHKRRHIG